MYTLCARNLISTFYYYHWVDTSADGLLVRDGIIHPLVSVSQCIHSNLHINNKDNRNRNNELFNVSIDSFYLVEINCDRLKWYIRYI
jgi:hypothetical protein